MTSLRDLTGLRFGRLTVEKRDDLAPTGARVHWLCICDCGLASSVRAGALTSGNTRSCGKCFSVDHTGRIYGVLTVIGWAGVVRGRSSWNCHCICGRIRVVRADGLTALKHKACLCEPRPVKEKHARKIRAPRTTMVRAPKLPADLAGRRFGRLLVTRRSEVRSSNGAITWECDCDCGASAFYPGSDLLRGRAVSCGCFRREEQFRRSSAGGAKNLKNLLGLDFGRLTIIKRLPNDRKHVIWLTKCACGNELAIRSGSLISGSTISCGCAKKDKPGLMPPAALERALAGSHKRRARIAKVGGSFTADEIAELYIKQRGRCGGPACGAQLGKRFHRDHNVPLSLGGSNSIKNIVLLCEPCNRRKGARDPFVWAQMNGRLL